MKSHELWHCIGNIFGRFKFNMPVLAGTVESSELSSKFVSILLAES